MWETENNNIDSSGKTGNSKSVIELDKVNHAEGQGAEVKNISNRFQDFKS